MIDRHPFLNTDLEEAAWERLSQSDRAVATAVVTRSRDMVLAYSRAVAAGHGNTAVLEVAGSLNVSQRTAENMLGAALQLMSQPNVVEAITEGRLGHFHALALLDELSGLSDEVADLVVTEVLDRAEYLPPARIRRLARRVALRLDPHSAARRRKEAAAERNFSINPAGDGMALVRLLVRAEAALQIAHRAEAATRADDGSGRTADQRRADWATDTLLGTRAGAGAGFGADAGAEPADDHLSRLDRRRRRRRHR